MSLSEKVGIPLALLLGNRSHVPHVLVAHHLTSSNKRSLQKRTGYLRRFDRVIVICRAQERYLLDEAGVSPARVCYADYRVDEQFWHGGVANDDKLVDYSRREAFVIAVGRERRDYNTLSEAATLLPRVKFVIVASSPWSRSGQSSPKAVPPNIELKRTMSWRDLRALYLESSVAVVPLIAGTMYGAGLTAILEAMATSKPVVATYTPGTAEYLADDAVASVVDPGDPARLASEIAGLIDNPTRGRRIGSAARRAVSVERTLDAYVSTIAAAVRSAMTNFE